MITVPFSTDLANHDSDMNVCHADGSVKRFKLTECHPFPSFYTYLTGNPIQGTSWMPNGYCADTALPGQWGYPGVYTDDPLAGSFVSTAPYKAFGYRHYYE
jgi:prepilin-type processing-associated H-X9-DG protein